MPRWWRLLVRFEWLSRVEVGLWGPFSVDVVAGRIGFLVLGGAAPGGRRGRWLERRRVVLRSHVLVLLIHGGLRPGGAGCWAVVLVVILTVVVVVSALLAVAPVVLVMVLPVCPDDPLAFQWASQIRHRLHSLGPHGLVGSGGGLAARLNGDRRRGVPRPWVGLAGDGGRLFGGG